MARNKEKPKPLSKAKRWGQGLLLLTAILNGAVFFLGLRLASWQEDLDGKMTDEMYFLRNDQAISSEIIKRTLLHASLNQLKIVRRVGRERISPGEYKMLLRDEDVFEGEINRSLRKIAGAGYLQGHDPSPGQDTDTMIASMSVDEISKKLPEWQEDAFRHIKGVKASMNDIRARLQYWKVVNSSLLSFSTLFLIIGSYLIFKAEGEEAQI